MTVKESKVIGRYYAVVITMLCTLIPALIGSVYLQLTVDNSIKYFLKSFSAFAIVSAPFLILNVLGAYIYGGMSGKHIFIHQKNVLVVSLSYTTAMFFTTFLGAVILILAIDFIQNGVVTLHHYWLFIGYILSLMGLTSSLLSGLVYYAAMRRVKRKENNTNLKFKIDR